MSDVQGVRFQAASDQSLLVYFDQEITPQAQQSVLKLLRLLESKPVEGVRNVHPGYSSLLVDFDAPKMEHGELEAILRGCFAGLAEARLPDTRLVEIPVCYGGEFGPDLDAVAAAHGMTAAEAVELHVSASYTVCFFGFVPGFAYLGGLPERLATPRLATPRKRVPRGSVGVAGSQTGVYPLEVPGGWRLIGRTPARLFRPERDDMNLLAIGDRVRFTPISAERFAALEIA